MVAAVVLGRVAVRVLVRLLVLVAVLVRADQSEVSPGQLSSNHSSPDHVVVVLVRVGVRVLVRVLVLLHVEMRLIVLKMGSTSRSGFSECYDDMIDKLAPAWRHARLQASDSALDYYASCLLPADTGQTITHSTLRGRHIKTRSSFSMLHIMQSIVDSRYAA